ncbi:MAG: LLM class F420-dependent oxidoreductase [Acidimicrobiia bacterium]|nr:LLM class F420-dependent oxidoreductase [Acidimicrobiia bacterium]
MRYGAFLPQGWRLDLVGIDRSDHWPTMSRVANTIEAAGYESLWVYDHFHTVPVPTQEVTYEAWTLMAALGATTSSVRLGQMCTCNSYRPPAYLAKVAASIDVITNGRLEMGIGAGWYEHEYTGYGYPFPKPSVRIGQLREAVEIMRALWTEDEVDYDGEFYKLDGAICSPKPVQDPHIPLWIAGGGEKLTLRVAAKYANYTNFASTPEEFIHKSDILAAHCKDVGTDFSAIVRSTNLTMICAPTEAEVSERIDETVSRLAPLIGDEAAASARRLVTPMSGTPEQISEKLKPWVDAGVGYFIINFPDAAYDTAGLELFAKELAD